MWELFGGASSLGRVAINIRPTRGPWGGSSVFVAQFSRWLRRMGYRVTYRLDGDVDLIVVVDPREDLASTTFGMEAIRRYRETHPFVRTLHRVNECDQRKGSGFMDRILAQANAVCDWTVFISEWLRDYHAARWFDIRRPHSVVYNGADPAIFHPVGSARYDGTGPFRLVTHHWSDNRLKGFDVYEQLDAAIADGRLRNVELCVIGRWPDSVRWRAARTIGPCAGTRLAGLLRQSHAYLTASRWEPCGMHHVEGAQCGLPLLYHEDGGGIVEAGLKYGIGFRDDVGAAVEAMRSRYAECRKRVLERMPSGDQMCMDYARLATRLVMGESGE
jgi:glycosyltransferase involved in cell wall biosynthesis